MKLTTQQLDRLEQQAQKQIGLPRGTTVAVMPGELLELVAGYRQSSLKDEQAAPAEGALA